MIREFIFNVYLAYRVSRMVRRLDKFGRLNSEDRALAVACGIIR